MKDQERQQQILELLKLKGNVSVVKLINALQVSPATIRRDLTKMEAKGLIKRVHGGAILFVSNNAETSLILREEENKKEKKVKEKVVAPIVATPKAESIESRKEKFYQSLVPYVEKYGREMVRAFYDYWTELTPGGRKMRVEQQRVFEISKRLATWKKNETKYETNHNRHGESSNAAKAERDAEFFAHIREKLSRPNTDAEDLPYALQDI